MMKSLFHPAVSTRVRWWRKPAIAAISPRKIVSGAGLSFAQSGVMEHQPELAVAGVQIPIDLVVRCESAADPSLLREFTLRRLAFALRRFGGVARHVTVRLEDINGPRRGVDSRCSITLQCRDGRKIDVKATSAWPFASVTQAAKRLSTVIRRDVDKSHESVPARRRV
jgi:putative sigma-54 modulation protein